MGNKIDYALTGKTFSKKKKKNLYPHDHCYVNWEDIFKKEKIYPRAFSII